MYTSTVNVTIQPGR